MRYSGVHIIFNPVSTGDSKAAAYELARSLKKAKVGAQVECIPTRHQGHAKELAETIAAQEKQPLIVSSSGDGGYHEVVNGAMAAENEQAVCAVLPAGNANDHARTLHSAPLDKLILKARPKRLDLLLVTIRQPDGSVRSEYAHSYAGLGLTPVIAAELNRHTLNAFKELVIVLKRFYKYRPFIIERRGKRVRLDSLLFANINQMAKVLTLAPEIKPDDGKFEVISFAAGKKTRLLRRLFRAAVSSLPETSSVSRYVVKTVKQMPMQLDGEVISLPAGAEVEVTSQHRKLLTLV